MDIATLTQAPRELALAGATYPIRALKAREWGALHQWIKDHGEDPITRAVRQIDRTRKAGAPITPEQEDYLMGEAREEARRWPPVAGSTHWFEELGAIEGGDVEFLLAAVRTGRPGFTAAEAAGLAERLGPEESTALMLAALGLEPPPKAPTPPPASTTRRRRPDPSRTTGPRRSTG